MIIETDAVVLRKMKYGDTSYIITLYTRAKGKVKVIAKGARSSKSKFGSSLEPLTLSRVIYYEKANRDLYLLSKSEIRIPLRDIQENEDQLAAALAVIEIVNMMMHDTETDAPVFGLVDASLVAINENRKNPAAVLFAFQLQLLKQAGIAVSLGHCSGCGKKIDEITGTSVHLLISSGSIVCHDCSQQKHAGGMKVSLGAVRSLQHLWNSNIQSAHQLSISAGVRDEILAVMQTYLHYHIEGLRTLRSISMFHHYNEQ